MFTTFAVAFILNTYIAIFGSNKLKQIFKENASIKSYLNEIVSSSEELLGKKNVTTVRIVFSICLILLLFASFFTIIKLVISFCLGTYLSKRIYEVPAVNNVTNKISTYITRFFK